jgi:hypothetical protein
MTTLRRFACAALTLALLSCTGSPSEPDPVDLTGTWTGWVDRSVVTPSNAVLHIVQTGTSLTATGSIDGIGLTMTGSFDEPDFIITITVTGDDPFTFTGYYSESTTGPERYLSGVANGSGYTNAPVIFRL